MSIGVFALPRVTNNYLAELGNNCLLHCWVVRMVLGPNSEGKRILHS